MKEFITAIILILFIAPILYYIRKRRAEQRINRHELPDEDPVMDEVQNEDWNGNDLYIKEEDRAIWDGLSRKEKRELMRLQDKKIKSGELVRFTDENGFTGLLTRKEAKAKGYIK